MKCEKTEEEKQAIEVLKNEKWGSINSFLCEDAEKEITFAQESIVKYDRENIKQNIEIIQKTYEAMVRNFEGAQTVYKVADLSQVEEIKKARAINCFWCATLDKNEPEEHAKNALGTNVIFEIKTGEVPYICLGENSKELLISPFFEIADIEENENLVRVSLKKTQINLLSEDDLNAVYENIFEDIDNVNEKISASINLDNENAENYENIRKLEQLLARHHFTIEQENYETEASQEEKQSRLEDISRIETELGNLKSKVAEVFNKKLENLKFIADWKSDILTYLKNEFRKIDLKFIVGAEIQEESNLECVENTFPEDSKIANVKNECLENIAVVQTLLTNIKNLISKQQNHARIAGALDSNYKALNNGFEMKNFAEELDALVHAISNKVDALIEANEELEKISKTNLQISILLNYLNNAKSVNSKKITRFDEINIIEENELKKEIAETIKNIRCEAELKKLNDDEEILEDKSGFKKFLGRITGRNKIDETMLNQIKVRQIAVRKTFKAKMPLAHNYSIHELIAEIEMFIQENKDDELVTEEVSSLRKIKEVLKKNFVIIDSKVASIIDRKTGKNLPLTSKKMSKKELIEIDTYRFLNRYGYDKSYESTEPEYQDTMANEIKRIVDYIKSSGVL